MVADAADASPYYRRIKDAQHTRARTYVDKGDKRPLRPPGE
jgi:hypothetical protein